MSNIDIKTLAREYAEDMCPVKDYEASDDFSRCCDLDIYKDDFNNVVKWLSERFYLVPKSEAKRFFDDFFCEPTGLMGQRFKKLFGKDMFEEGKV